MKNLISGLVLCVLSIELHAATCIDTAVVSTPRERFYSVSDTVSDIETALMWTRCSIGQQYQDDECLGDPDTVTDMTSIEAAVQAANSAAISGHRDWRAPSIKELLSIVESSCFSPSVNDEVFPNTLPLPYATNSPDFVTEEPLYIDFEFGSQVVSALVLTRYLRLVRDIDVD